MKTKHVIRKKISQPYTETNYYKIKEELSAQTRAWHFFFYFVAKTEFQNFDCLDILSFVVNVMLDEIL